MYRFFQYVSSFLVQYSKTKKACPCGQVFFCFLSSNEVKSRFETICLATMPLATSICFFFDTHPVDIRRRSENLQKQPFAYIKCFTPKALPTSIGLLHVFVFPARFFTPSLSVKNIYHHKFCNKKAFFTQKNLFFTQFCYVLFIQFDKIYYYRLIFVIECVKIHYKYNKFDKICVVLSRFYGGQIEPANFCCADSGSIDCNRIQIGKVHQRHDFRQNSGGLA